ncbi:DUF2887 domain-containing protein [Arthrospira platensis FACHB-971]|nr:DUF2887 domain-containing protein [Arthrospira platensis FACHB-971]MBD2671774.1 DUF2887 domain-containing protein [Arthrospira platensis FACHB-439]MDT9313475.1 DUF2887 domain-containing protein [Limnospira sp. Paracas R14]BAI89921.1 hypothetical protein NIES39_D05030 [Arthrospira platensis NIES-39]
MCVTHCHPTSIFNIFQQYPRSFFELPNRPPEESDRYQFTSVEVKQLAFRLDGVFLPTTSVTVRRLGAGQ